MQAIGLWYTPDLFQDGARVKQELQKAKEQGFEIIIAFFRWMHLNVLFDDVVKAVARDVANAHKLGLKFVIDTDPTWWGINLTESCPDAAQRMVRRAEATAFGGKFSVYVPRTGAGNFHTQETYDRVLGIFVEDPAKGYRLINPKECKLQVETGTCTEGIYGANTEGSMNRFARISGVVPKSSSRKVILYVAFKVFCHADFAHPAFLKASKGLLDKYKDIPLDGVGWDEPGRSHGIGVSYRAGNGFLRFFRKYKGYDLEPNLIYLDDITNEKYGTKVRNDYYDSLAEMSFRAQGDHNRYAKKLFGKDILLGTHQTWGPTVDYAIGMGDYFRNGKVLNPAWVDLGRGDEEEPNFYEMLHVYCLGDSLRKEFHYQRAYSNDYFIPFRPEQVRFFLRMKMLFDISLFYLWIGEHTEWMPNSGDRNWPEVGKTVRELDAFQRLLGGQYRTLTDTAVLYSPVGIYAFPSGNMGRPTHNLLSMRYHLVRNFLRAGRTFDFVGGVSLERAKVSRNRFSIDDRSYRRLVLPWTASISERIWPVVKNMIKRGIPVIFVGSPLCRIAETGQDISREFFTTFGVDPFSLKDYMRYVEASHPEANPSYPFTQRAFPLAGKKIKVIGRSFDGDVAVVQGLEYPQVIYDSSLDILNKTTYGLMRDTKPTGITVHVNNGYYRIFEKVHAQDTYLVLIISGMRTSLAGHLKVGHETIELSGGSYAAFKVEHGCIRRDKIFTDGTEIKEENG